MSNEIDHAKFPQIPEWAKKMAQALKDLSDANCTATMSV